jgi:hypothetical protein
MLKLFSILKIQQQIIPENNNKNKEKKNVICLYFFRKKTKAAVRNNEMNKPRGRNEVEFFTGGFVLLSSILWHDI